VAVVASPTTQSAPATFSLLKTPAPLRWWHLLSLDAPTVAAVWAWSFAHCSLIHLPIYSIAILALGTWLIYIADRILDGWKTLVPEEMRERHYFHRRHWRSMIFCGAGISALLLWLILTCMPASAKREDTALFLIAMAYFAAVHFRKIPSKTWPSKELMVGIIFACATAVPVWSRLEQHPTSLTGAVILFAMLCWLNCIGIERWENHTNRILPRFRMLTGVAGALAALGTLLAHATHLPIEMLYIAACLSAALLYLLDRFQDRFSLLTIRVAADLALITPLLVFPWYR
jgi:hypothetical protein